MQVAFGAGISTREIMGDRTPEFEDSPARVAEWLDACACCD
ncbi:MAG TPA: hypothetical protein VGO48_01855 [Conexibacter sp.]|nr:hypothetical protein [Conexibacter sp.]